MIRVILFFLFTFSATAFFSGYDELTSINYTYDVERDKVICTAVPKKRIKGSYYNYERGERRQFKLSECEKENDYHNTYRWGKGEKDKQCYLVGSVGSYYVAIKKAEIGNCSSWSNEIDTKESLDGLRKEAALNSIYTTCKNLNNCVQILGNDQVDLVNSIARVMQEVDVNSFKKTLNDSSTEFYDVRRKYLKSVEAIKSSLSKCMYGLPSVRESLSEDLSKMIRTLDRDILVFHYFHSDKINHERDDTPGLNNPRAIIYANVMESLFWDKTNTGDMIGQGLYASADPLSTSSYGDYLLEIEVPENTKILDLRKGGNYLIISGRTKELLISSGCDVSSLASNYNPSKDLGVYEGGAYRLDKSELYSKEECVRIFNNSVEDSGAGLLAYNYGQDYRHYCDSTNRGRGTAFVLFDLSLNPGTINVYDTRDSDRHEERAYQRIRTIQGRSTGVDANTRDRIQSETKDQLFGCSKEYQDY